MKHIEMVDIGVGYWWWILVLAQKMSMASLEKMLHLFMKYLDGEYTNQGEVQEHLKHHFDRMKLSLLSRFNLL